MKKARPPEGYGTAQEISAMFPQYSAYQICAILTHAKHPKIKKPNEMAYYSLDGIEDVILKHVGLKNDEIPLPRNKVFSFGSLDAFREIARSHRDKSDKFWG